MKKTFTMLAMVLALSLVMVMPLSAQAEIGNSGTIREDLTVDQLQNVMLKANGLDIEIKATTDETPYAELDATVIGIDSAEVEYGLTATSGDVTEGEETKSVLTLDAYHTGSDIGLDMVKLVIYVPATAIENLELELTGSNLSFEGITLQSLTGSTMDGKLTMKDDTVESIDLTTSATELNMAGAFNGLTLATTGGVVKVTSTVVPAMVQINANNAAVELKVPETDEGFVMNYTVTDGKLNTNFVSDYSEASGTVTYGTGTAQFDITVSGANLDVSK